MKNKTISQIMKAVSLGTATAVIVLQVLGAIQAEAAITLLSLGLLSVALLSLRDSG